MTQAIGKTGRFGEPWRYDEDVDQILDASGKVILDMDDLFVRDGLPLALRIVRAVNALHDLEYGRTLAPKKDSCDDASD